MKQIFLNLLKILLPETARAISNTSNAFKGIVPDKNTKVTKKKDLIADVQMKGSWIEVYDINNNRISNMALRQKNVVAFSELFFVIVEGSWIETYDVYCNKIASTASRDYIVRNATGNTFTLVNGNWIDTYDINCKKINTRPLNK
jgi:hypothetical protein